MKTGTPHCVLFALTCVAVDAAAQAPPHRVATRNWIIERWSTDQSLPQATVRDIAQTPDGYLWLATYGGLVRFDGVRFTAFASNEFPALGSDRVMAMRSGPDGSLWLGTDRALVRYRDGQFRQWGDSAGRPRGQTSAVFPDSSGVWVATSIDGVAHLVGDRFERFTARGVPDQWAGAVVRDRAGNVWVDRGNGRTLVRPADASGFAVPPLSTGIVGHTLLQELAVDGSPLFMTGQGVARWTGSALVPLGIAPGIVIPDREGGYWSASTGGISHIDAKGTAEFVVTEAEAGIRDVRSGFVDRDGTLWLGTETLGLVRFRRRVVHMYFREDGLAGEAVLSILRDRHNRLIASSSCGPASEMIGGRLTKSALPGCAFAMAEGLDGTLWVAPSGGLTGYSHDGRRFDAPFFAKLPNRNILAMYADRDSSLWIGTENGLAHYARGEVRNYSAADGLGATEIHYITRDRRGALWVGTVGGLARLDGARFTSWTRADGLAHDYVRAIYQDADGIHWIGTYGGGLSRFDGKQFVTISRQDGLYDNIVSSIHEDAKGNLWMSGNRGVYRASRQSLNAFADGQATQVASVGYGPSDGLLTSETNGGFQPSAWQDADGRLWFATVRGLATIDPSEAAPAATPPSLAIESFHVDGRAMPTTGTVELPVGSRYLEITYTGLTSDAPEQLAFRYKLDGLDRDWVYVNARRTAYYPQLAPGTYTFTVSAANRNGGWNPLGKQLSFAVPAPWYATWWFRVFALLVVVGTGSGVVRQRVQRAHERARIQREFSRQLLLGQEIERGRLAGELHDSLGQDLLVMKNRAALALRSEKVPGDVRGHVEEIASVALQALQHTRAMSHGLRPFQLKHIGLGASLEQLGEATSAASGVSVEVSTSGVDERVGEEAAIQVYRIVQEALNNILKHAEATTVSITMAPQGAGVGLRITDNGRGMDLSKPFGFGLTGIQQRVHLLGGTVDIRSAPGGGTTIDALLPGLAS